MWRRPGAPEPLGAPGLVRFTPEPTVAWEYPGEVPSTGVSGSPGPVDECAAGLDEKHARGRKRCCDGHAPV